MVLSLAKKKRKKKKVVNKTRQYPILNINTRSFRKLREEPFSTIASIYGVHGCFYYFTASMTKLTWQFSFTCGHMMQSHSCLADTQDRTIHSYTGFLWFQELPLPETILHGYACCLSALTYTCTYTQFFQATLRCKSKDVLRSTFFHQKATR